MNNGTVRLASFSLVAVFLGMFAALLYPKASRASTNYSLWLHPTTSYLTCGWHSGACWDDDSLVSTGWALDIHPNPGGSSFVYYIYFKAANLASLTTAETGVVSYDTGTCKHWTYVSVYGNDGIWKADVRAVHTVSTATGTYFYINSSGIFTPATTHVAVGYATDESGCAWTGYHVHEESGGGWPNKLYYPDHTDCNEPNIPDECGVKNNDANAMLSTDWTS